MLFIHYIFYKIYLFLFMSIEIFGNNDYPRLKSSGDYGRHRSTERDEGGKHIWGDQREAMTQVQRYSKNTHSG